MPYASVVVRLDDGKAVKANLIGVEPEPSALRPGLRVELAVWSAGTDSEGTEALTFGFRPLDTPEPGASV